MPESPHSDASDAELRARVERERKHYADKEQSLKRGGLYARIVHGHIRDNPNNKRGLAKTREIIMPGHKGHVLEIGCRSWPMWISSGQCRPKKLTCINISESELEEGRALAAASGLDIEFEFRLMDAHHLEFADQSFDVVYGGGILHHLDYRKALPEFRRVLKPGGVCAFQEPLRLNPLGGLLRKLTPNARTPDEMPLGYPELRLFGELFDARFHYYQFASVVLGAISPIFYKDFRNPIMNLADRIDTALVSALPQVGPFFRYVVLEGHRRKD